MSIPKAGVLLEITVIFRHETILIWKDLAANLLELQHERIETFRNLPVYQTSVLATSWPVC